MKKWVKAYVTGSTNSAATQKARLTCVPIGVEGLSFGLGIGCSGGWYGYTGGIPGYNTGAYYFPEKDATIIAFVNSQVEKPEPGVANSIVRDFTQILFPNNVAFPPPGKPNQTAEKAPTAH
jgi:D-alanyl-D-alanine carboxypeptidase